MKKAKLYIKKILKNETSIRIEKIIICVLSLNTFDKSFTGRKPPDEIKVNAKLSELKDLIDKIFSIMKITRVNEEYNKKIFVACFKISELSKEMKFVSVFLKFSS